MFEVDELLKRLEINPAGRIKATLWYMAVFLSLCLEWWLLKWSLEIEYNNIFGTLLKSIGDIALILLPYWLLSPRWRWTALLPVFFMAVWGVCNITYYRFWNEIIPAASVTMGGNLGGDIMLYTVSLLRWSDIGFVLLFSFAWISYYCLKPYCSKPYPRKSKVLFVTGSLLVGILGQASYFKSIYSWRFSNYGLGVKDALSEFYTGVYNSQKQLYSTNGPVYYGARYIYEIFNVLSSSVELSDSQNKEIEEFLGIYGMEGDNKMTISELDSRNVVYIIVESLNSDMLGKNIGGIKIMPFLDSLANARGTVLFDNVVSQTKISSSSDGHLLLMTGLLPPEKVSYSITYGSKNVFPSIADALHGHHKYLLLADDGVCWNEGNTLRQFGLGEPLVDKDWGEYYIDELGRDGAMFRYASEMMKTIEHPFFMTLMTISMHIPFIEEAWKVPTEIENAEDLSRMEKDYAGVCHHTDKYIKEFVESLPENTLIFIASDHSQSLAAHKGNDARGVFMAVNSGRTEHISRVVGQVNIFPAALEILGSGIRYRGLAVSAFNPCVDGTIDSYGKVYGNPTRETIDTLSNAYRISDMIIRGDYFKNRK